MPDLLHLLRSQDLGQLRIVADLWGLDFQPADLEGGPERMVSAMLDAQLANEILESLEPPARAALQALARAAGRIPWVAFSREFGEVREMGAARRDRERPQRHPASPAEVLFYRALLGRAFFETAAGPQEFAYLPEDLLRLLHQPPEQVAAPATLGRPASAAERSRVSAASDRILDDATAFLAALRLDQPLPQDPVLRALLECSGVLQRGVPQAAQVKAFLERPRAQALHMLVEAWRACDAFDELRLVPGLVCEGPWVNQPRATRLFLLKHLESIPQQTWWSLQAFVEDVKQRFPDFQRPAGDYDSWFIRSSADGNYLRGFDSWDQVEGALIRFLVTRVMPRLGLLDLASPGEGQPPSAFRSKPVPAATDAPEDGRLLVNSIGRIVASHQVPRAVRYQLARFCEWDDAGGQDLRFHISPASLAKARQQGLTIEQLLALLARHAQSGIPPTLVKALKRWEANGTEARAETRAVLKVSKPEILKELRRSKAAKYLGETLGPTTVIVKAGAIRKVAEAMTELGVLLEDGLQQPESGDSQPVKPTPTSRAGSRSRK